MRVKIEHVHITGTVGGIISLCAHVNGDPTLFSYTEKQYAARTINIKQYYDGIGINASIEDVHRHMVLEDLQDEGW